MTRDLILALLVLGGFALLAGGVFLIARGRDRRKGVLMVVCAIVVFGNVAIWSWPA